MFRRFAILMVLTTAFAGTPVHAVDPPYQSQMERLSEIMGSLYFLAPLCRTATGVDWRQEMADLIALDQPDEDRRQRLAGAFNAGYEAYSRLYRNCTPSANAALNHLLAEAETTARDIHSRYAE